MPKLPALTSKQLIKKLKKLGFQRDHTTGSHIVFYHPSTNRRAIVPHHLKDLKKGTLHSILKESSISIDELSKV